MLKKGLNRVSAVLLVLLMTSSMLLPGFALPVEAEENQPNYLEDNETVTYYRDNDGAAIGYKTITLNDVIYYDVADYINGQDCQYPEITEDVILNALVKDNADLKKNLLKKYGIIAKGMIEDLGNTYSCNNMPGGGFWKDFASGNSDDDEYKIDDIAKVFASPIANVGLQNNKHQGSRGDDYATSTPLFTINSLNDLRERMAKEIADANENDIKKSVFLDVGPDIQDTVDGGPTGQEGAEGDQAPVFANGKALPDMKSTQKTLGYGKIVTSLNERGGTSRFDYASFGIAFYDFDLMPLASEDFRFITDFEQYKKVQSPEDCYDLLSSNNNFIATGKIPDSEKEPIIVDNQTNQTVKEKVSYKVKSTKSQKTKAKEKSKYKFGLDIEANFGWRWSKGSWDWWHEWTKNPASKQSLADYEEFVSDGGGRVTQDASLEFSFKKSWTHSETTSTALKQTSTHKGNLSVAMPPHTAIVTNFSSSTDGFNFEYHCPVALTYKVVVFGMSGDMYSDGEAVNTLSTAGYTQSCFSAFLGSNNSLYGQTAESNLRDRLSWDGVMDQASYDGIRAKTNCWTNDDEPEKNWINWVNVKNKIGSEIDLDESAKYVPMSAIGAASLEYKNQSEYMELASVQPLYELSRVNLINPSDEEKTVNVNEKLRLSSIRVHGFDKEGTTYYGFSADKGCWALCNDQFQTIESSPYVDINTTENGYQILTGKAQGDVYLRWVPKDGVEFTSADGVTIDKNNFEEKLPLNDTTNPRHAIIHVKVAGNPLYPIQKVDVIPKDQSEVVTTGNLNDFLHTRSTNSIGQYVDSDIIWRAQDQTDNAKYTVSSDGDLTFEKPGNYDVAAGDRLNNQAWGEYPIKARKIELSEGCYFLDQEGNPMEGGIYAVGDGVRIRSDSDSFVGFRVQYPDGKEEMIFPSAESEIPTAFFVMPEIGVNDVLTITGITSEDINETIYEEEEDSDWAYGIPEEDMNQMYIADDHTSASFDLNTWVGQGTYSDNKWNEYSKTMKFYVAKAQADGEIEDDVAIDQEEELQTQVDGATVTDHQLKITKPGTYSVTGAITKTADVPATGEDADKVENQMLDKKSIQITVREVTQETTILPEDEKEKLEASTITSTMLNADGDVEVCFEAPQDRDGTYVQYATNESFVLDDEDYAQEIVKNIEVEGNGDKAVLESLDRNKTWFVQAYAYQAKDDGKIYGIPSSVVPLDFERMDVEKAILDIPSPIASLEDSREAIEKTLESFDKLTEDQKKQVAKEAVAKAADMKAVLAAVDAIEAVKGEDAPDLKVIEASKTYEALSESQLAMVSEEDRALLEETLSKQEGRVAQKIAAKAKELIEKLPDEADIKDKEQTTAAREAYDLYEKMSSRMKKTVKDFAAETLKLKLEAAEAKIKAAEEALKQKPAREPVKTVKVSKIRLTGISRMIAAGKKIKLKATVLPANASNKKLKWTSSNKKIATVTQTGLVKVKKKTGGRNVKIIAASTDGSKVKAIWKIKSMKGVVKKITVKGAKKTLKAGKTMKIKATVKATKGANKKLRWTSSNKKYATVTSAGKVKALKAGKGKTVKITVSATDGSNKKKVCKITIK